MITLDTHVDINVANFTKERNYTQDLPTQVNLPKMLAGGLDAETVELIHAIMSDMLDTQQSVPPAPAEG